jgi:signal transduction histidine kinase
MAAEARCVAGPGDADIVTRGEDEVGTVGNYLRALTSDVIQARSKLEHSRIQLTRAEKLAAVGELAASVAHEIRNPLTSIKLWLYSIRQSVADNSEVDSRCALVSDEVTRLDRIIGNFLEFSRPPEVHVRQCGISTLLEKTMELFTPRMQQSRIKCSCEIKPGLPQVMADPCQLRQVVGNLLANAVDAMPGGGSLRISADAEKDQGKDAVIVRVADTGPGIPECAITRIFDPFFSTKPHGTGLGLAIATRIMEQHHGRLTIESSTGDGTTFAISIPTAGVNGSE